MEMTPEQRVEFEATIEDWKRGYDLSWSQLRAENEMLRGTIADQERDIEAIREDLDRIADANHEMATSNAQLRARLHDVTTPPGT